MKKKAPQKTVSMEELLETESRWEKVKRFMRTNKLDLFHCFFAVFHCIYHPRGDLCAGFRAV